MVDRDILSLLEDSIIIIIIIIIIIMYDLCPVYDLKNWKIRKDRV